MKNFIKLLCGISFVFGVQSALACEYPERVSIPNGTTATKEEMLEDQVKASRARRGVHSLCLGR